MTLGVRALAFDQNGRILLVKHTYVPGWHLCGGGVEPGETAVDALRKELNEEANVELVEEPFLQSVHFNRAVSRRDHVLVYRCNGVTQTAPKQADREILEARFFALHELPDDLSSSSRTRIEEALNRQQVSAFWS